MEKPIGIYVHFPFCKQKCYYCDFNSYSGIERLIPDYAAALIKEMQRFLPCGHPVRSIYFGGGTPSCLPAELLIQTLEFIKGHFLLLPESEITIEINPGTIEEDSLARLVEGGFNRLSIGVQASQDRLLHSIGRIHRWDDFIQTFESARKSGFSNINIDLIFGLPGQSTGDWEETLAKVMDLRPEHISAYGLQIEPDTPLSRMIESGRMRLPTEETVVEMMRYAMAFLPGHGYTQYEISNYARNGYQSRHNLGYWSGEPYLGFGAGATSTLNGERWTNLRSPTKYLKSIANGSTVASEIEPIDRQTALIERLMLGLRLRAGISLSRIRSEYGLDLKARLDEEIQFLKNQQLVIIEGDYLRLTDQAILIGNQVITKLLNRL